MESPLWTDRYAPTLADIPQAHLRTYLRTVAGRPVNLLLYGPPGGGKTAAVRAYARHVHPNPETDLLVLNVADFFNRSKDEIANDPRFAGFLGDSGRRSKREMINHVFRESTAHAPIEGSFRTVLLDNAEAVREDFQQSLRRLIERHHRTTQFVLTTRQLGKIIPPLRSRCFPVPVPRPSDDAIVHRLETIFEAESIEYESAAIRLVAEEAEGNLRRAIMAAQTTVVVASREGEPILTEEAVYGTLKELGHGEAIDRMLAAAEGGDFADAREVLDDLLVAEGLDATEILTELLGGGRTRYDETEIAGVTRLAADVDFNLATGGDDRVQLSRLLAQLGSTG